MAMTAITNVLIFLKSFLIFIRYSYVLVPSVLAFVLVPSVLALNNLTWRYRGHIFPTGSDSSHAGLKKKGFNGIPVGASYVNIYFSKKDGHIAALHKAGFWLSVI